MTRQTDLELHPAKLFEASVLTRRLVAAHLHSMHPANRSNRPAALGKPDEGDDTAPST